MQIEGFVSPVPYLVLSSLSLRVAPGLLSASVTGLLHGAPVDAVLTSSPQPGNSSRFIGSIRVASQEGASMDALLASQSALVKAEAGLQVPEPQEEPASPDAGSAASYAELIFDSEHGLRLLNMSLAGAGPIGISNVARRVGFSWPAEPGSDPLSFSAAWLYYVPNRPSAPPVVFNGRQIGQPELGIAATVDVPAVGISSTRSTLLIEPGGKLSLQVSTADMQACSKADL
jgi:hypothetical protein